MNHRDPRGHYAALNVSPDASSEEILLSYRFLKEAFKDRREKLNIGAIQEAYEILSDAQSKAEHAFHNGARARAYLLRQGDQDPGVWYPAGDLARLAQPR